MGLKMEVYSPGLELLGLLEIQNSVIWERKAFSSGSFSLTSLITDESKALLVPENIIWISGDYAGIIEYVHQESGEDGPYITVKGCDLTGILSRRILWGQYNLNGPIPDLMYHLVDDCCIHPTQGDAAARKIPGLVLAGTTQTNGPSIRLQKTGGFLLEALEEMGETYQVPFGVRFNPAVPQMEFWARYGINRTVSQKEVDPVFYSTELDDVLSSEYSYNAQNYRNVALVAGEGEGKDRVMITVSGDTEPIPEFPSPPTPVLKYAVTLSVDPEGGGTATGGGQFERGQNVTVSATAEEGYDFFSWQENGQTVSENAKYEFEVTEERALTAVFTVSSRLPKGYTEVEYILSDIACGIDTGYNVNFAHTRVLLDIEAQKFTSVTEFIFGSASESSRYFLLTRSSSTNINSRYNTNSVKNIRVNIADQRIVIDWNFQNEKLTVGDTAITTQKADATIATNFFLFRYANNSKSIQAKLYSAKIYSDDKLERDFVPCINPDGIVGLYDLIRNRFYQNSGTGNFTAGPSV